MNRPKRRLAIAQAFDESQAVCLRSVGRSIGQIIDIRRTDL